MYECFGSGENTHTSRPLSGRTRVANPALGLRKDEFRDLMSRSGEYKLHLSDEDKCLIGEFVDEQTCFIVLCCMSADLTGYGCAKHPLLVFTHCILNLLMQR